MTAVPQDDSDFDRATAVVRSDDGRLAAELDPGWEVGNGILNGEYLLAVLARVALLESRTRTRSPSRPAICRPPPVGR